MGQNKNLKQELYFQEKTLTEKKFLYKNLTRKTIEFHFIKIFTSTIFLKIKNIDFKYKNIQLWKRIFKTVNTNKEL